MDFELSDHDFMPSRDVVYEHFQANFHQTVVSKHVILEATEVPYTEAKDFNAQIVALSTYTNTHALKKKWLPSVPVTGDLRAIDRS